MTQGSEIQTLEVTKEMVQGALSFEQGDSWLKPWRLPFDEIELFHPDLVARAEKSAGVRLYFRTNSTTITLQLALPGAVEQENGHSTRFDLTTGPDLLASIEPEKGATEITFSGLSNEKTYELWLPVFIPCKLQSLKIDKEALFEIPNDTRKRWITYGSSITHCGTAHSPARTWPAVVARAHNLNLTCLGFGGNCHLETVVGRVLRDTPADIMTMKLGINTTCSLSDRSFRTATMGLVKLVREKQPDIPIGIISPIINPPRESAEIENGHNLQSMRQTLENNVRILKDYGDSKIEYFNGLNIIGEADTSCLPDELHPNGDGYQLMGARIADYVLGPLIQKYIS
jgi:lysophospholipase L1-like esterase